MDDTHDKTPTLPGIDPADPLQVSEAAVQASILLVRYHEGLRLGDHDDASLLQKVDGLLEGVSAREKLILANLRDALWSLDEREALEPGHPEVHPAIAISKEHWVSAIGSLRHRCNTVDAQMRSSMRAACFRALGFRAAAAAFGEHAVYLSIAASAPPADAGARYLPAARMSAAAVATTAGRSREAVSTSPAAPPTPDAPLPPPEPPEPWEARFLALQAAKEALIASLPEEVHDQLRAALDGGAATLLPEYVRQVALRERSKATLR